MSNHLNHINAVTASAPGSIMVAGEHAVVYDYPAIVAAIAQRITVSVKKREDRKLIIHSALVNYEATIDDIQMHPDLKFVLACIQNFEWTSGLELWIESEINHQLGLGSSAAVTVATLAALYGLQKQACDKQKLHHQALSIIHDVQQRGSGADLAASIWGGMIAYYPNPLSVTSLPIPEIMMSLQNCGYKTPTATVLALISEKMKIDPKKYQQLYQAMGNQTEIMISQALSGDWADFYQGINTYQEYMIDLGVSDDVLDTMIQQAKQQKTVFASKISGSGLGDCIVSFSKILPANHSQVVIDLQGVRIDENS